MEIFYNNGKIKKFIDYLDLDSKKYRPWAAKPIINKDSDTHVRCTWCNKEMMIGSLYGSNGHLKNSSHLEKEEEYIKKKEEVPSTTTTTTV